MKAYQIEPMGAPRMTRADRWKKRPVVLRYHEFKDMCRLHNVCIPEAGALVTFVLPMPESWPEKKREAMTGKPHQQKPDIDNLEKGLLDAVFPDDSHVWDIHTRKIWGAVGMIIVEEP